MFGLDEQLVDLSQGRAVGLVLLVAIVLGVRHAADPDHVAAVTTIFASGRERATRAAGWLGVSWGVGHGVTLMAFGLPAVMFGADIPGGVQRGCQVAVAGLLVFLAIRLITRWRRGAHHHRGTSERAVRDVPARSQPDDRPRPDMDSPTRTVRAAFGIGLIHGIGGSAGASVLVLASVESRALAIVSLALLAIFTIPSMWLITTAFGVALIQRPMQARMSALTPVLGTLTLGFGLWYGAGAIGVSVYPF